MIVLTGREMAALDARAQAVYGMPGLILMENAGREVASLIEKRFGRSARVIVVCGSGNNGGDGLVVGRHLFLAGHPVELWLMNDEADYREDALKNLHIAQSLGLSLRRLEEGNFAGFAAALRQGEVVVDALFGTGFHGVPRPGAARILRTINAAERPVVAVDIPSGVDADTGAVPGEAIRATITVTFAVPKLGCLLFPGADLCGEMVVVPISLPPPESFPGTPRFLTEPRDVAAVLPGRRRDAHKGLGGRVLVVGGSSGLSGAPFLAARGALRAGAGLVTAILPAGLPLGEKPAEVMVGMLPADADAFGPGSAAAIGPYLGAADVLAVGPGMGRAPGAWELLSTVLAEWEGPLVLDADGLNLLALHRGAVKRGSGRWVMTPHPGEMARLSGASVHEVQADRLGYALRTAEEWQATVVLKGVPTVVAGSGGTVWLNPTGHPAMATGGMGDVLTGVIAGLIGQGVGIDEAAIAGVYLHGLAGEMAAEEAGGPGILAGEVADLLPAAAKRVKAECRVMKS